MVEQDVIGHLMDVERLAYDLLSGAQAEADKRKGEAKEKAERLFLAEYEKIISSFESVYAVGAQDCSKSRELEYDRYDSYLKSIPQDQKALNAYLDGLCFGS